MSISTSQMYDTRKENLRALIDDRYDGKPLKLAQRMGKAPTMLYRVLAEDPGKSTRNIGEGLARDVERISDIALGSLDMAPPAFRASLAPTTPAGPEAAIPETVGQRLTWAVDNQRAVPALTREELARSVGSTPVEIMSLESDQAENPRLLAKLASRLEANFIWLLDGIGDRHVMVVGGLRVHGAARTGSPLHGDNFRVIQQELEYRELPLLNYASAGDYCEAVESALAHPGDHKLIACPIPCGPKSFWVKVQGGSMTNPGGDSYPHGDMVAFDCDKEPVPGRPVIARLATGECTLKNYELDSDGTPFLMALNPDWPDRRTPMPEGVHVCAAFVCHVRV